MYHSYVNLRGEIKQRKWENHPPPHTSKKPVEGETILFSQRSEQRRPDQPQTPLPWKLDTRPSSPKGLGKGESIKKMSLKRQLEGKKQKNNKLSIKELQMNHSQRKIGVLRRHIRKRQRLLNRISR
ncbi:hypothetical protein CHS0354_008697 [Potamilus streckersoni]|uniref:Uncharacterized protein n=1 Tax=Potamilus streckersoni TaxID=2493646 RepID=A0AAE0THG2_9BIVA|nr:hypothetical protein CHS0354_008697 [Potamilus streckersoni]